MKDEIKEILEYLRVYAGLRDGVYLTDIEQYINILQKELETTQKLAVNYKSRIDKAIEYIEARTFDEISIAPFVDDFNFKENILNILKGGDE